jgi:hypothetical protein
MTKTSLPLTAALLAALPAFMPTRKETPMYVLEREIAMAKAKDRKQKEREGIRARKLANLKENKNGKS